MATFSRQATLDWSGDVLRGIGSETAGSDAFATGATFRAFARAAEGGCTILAAIRGSVAVSVHVHAV